MDELNRIHDEEEEVYFAQGKTNEDKEESVTDTDDFSNLSPNGVAIMDMNNLEALAASNDFTLTPANIASEQAARIDRESEKVMEELEERNKIMLKHFL